MFLLEGAGQATEDIQSHNRPAGGPASVAEASFPLLSLINKPSKWSFRREKKNDSVSFSCSCINVWDHSLTRGA